MYMNKVNPSRKRNCNLLFSNCEWKCFSMTDIWIDRIGGSQGRQRKGKRKRNFSNEKASRFDVPQTESENALIV